MLKLSDTLTQQRITRSRDVTSLFNTTCHDVKERAKREFFKEIVMSFLKPGTLCVIVGGCPGNIGLIVEVLEHIGPYPPRADAYLIRTVSGRNFPQLKTGKKEKLIRGTSIEAVTDRHKLRPLIDPKEDPEIGSVVEKRVMKRKRELETSSS